MVRPVRPYIIRRAGARRRRRRLRWTVAGILLLIAGIAAAGAAVGPVLAPAHVSPPTSTAQDSFIARLKATKVDYPRAIDLVEPPEALPPDVGPRLHYPRVQPSFPNLSLSAVFEAFQQPMKQAIGGEVFWFEPMHQEVQEWTRDLSARELEQALGNTASFERFLAQLAQRPLRAFPKRPLIPTDSAAFFLFFGQQHWAFWMKDVFVPLDVLFLDENERIVGIQSMAPEPGVPDDQLVVYRSRAPAVAAIVLPGGTAERLGLKIGTSLS